MDRRAEVEAKLERVREALRQRGRRGLLLLTHGNFAWITAGGRNHVSVAAERGVAGVLVTPDEAWLLADNIEGRRLLEEELGEELPFRPVEFPWWSGSAVEEALARVPAAELEADVPIPGAHSLGVEEGIRLRNPLLPPEIARYRELGERVGIALTHVAFHCRPGLSEHQLAGMLARTLVDFGAVPAVTLVAVDERAFTRRHPLPTDRRLERFAMLVAGARAHGLHVSATRLVHFGPAPEALRQRHLACARIDAALIAATRPGVALSAVFAAGQRAYAAEGYPDEWQRHHQGGPTGYAGRDLRVTPTAPGEVLPRQAFAWNPTLPGVKSEDTFLIDEEGPELLSPTPDLPSVEVEAEGRCFFRPGILER